MIRNNCFLLALVAAAALTPASAWAERSGSDGTTTIGPTQSGPVITVGSAGFDQTGTSADAASRSQAAAPVPDQPPTRGTGDISNITFRQIPNNAIPSGGIWVDQNGTIHILPAIPASACPPGQTGFYRYDGNGTPLGIVCVENAANPAPGAPARTPLELAQEASAIQPWPVLQVSANPTVGLTGLPTWFWLTGTPQMPDATASAGPLTVTVHATLADVIWRFGDGSGFSSGTNVGQPSSNDIEHVYQTDTFGRATGYRLSALLRYQVTYSVNGGPFNVLGVKARPFVTTYQVNQLQPQAVSAG